MRAVINQIVRKQKVAMFHPGRCGSTVLGSLMNQNPNLFWSGEPFEKLMKIDNPLSAKEVKSIIKEVERQRISKVYCFATKYPKDMHLSKDCINMNVIDYVELLDELSYEKFILINRSNHLRRAISMEQGRLTNKWHSNSKTEVVTKVKLDPDRFVTGLDVSTTLVEYFKSLDEEHKMLLDLLSKHKLISINYEDDIEDDPVVAYNKVCGFLEVEATPVTVSLRKTNPYSAKDSIENFSEVENALKNTVYEWMLSK